MFISSTASSALFPRHGAPAECAVSPRNEYSTDTRPVPARSPHDTARSFETCANNATSTSLKKPSRTKCALVPSELFGGPRPDPDRPGKLLPLHDLLHRDRRGDVDRLSRVVSLAVSRPAFDQRVAIGDAGLLRRLRDAVDVGAERNHRLAGSPARHERGRDAGDPLFHREPVLLQEVDQIAVRLLLLEAELTVAEDLIDHLLRERRHAVDGACHLALQTIDAWIDLHGRGRLRRLLRQRRRDDRTDHNQNRQNPTYGHTAPRRPLVR